MGRISVFGAPASACALVCAAMALAALFGGCAGTPGKAPESAARAVAPGRTTKILLSNAEGHFFRGNILQAIAAYSEIIAAEPQNAFVFRCRAAALAVLGREADALADYGRAVELDPRLDEAWLGRGLYHFSRGRYAEAIEDFDHAAALDRHSAAAHKYRALACEKVGRLREAAISREAYIHCENLRELPESAGEGAPVRELKALGLE
ncbi:MAG TPA: tetratricopeptide repeat protein [Candidatus Methanoperedens sp.]|nr:tetratricopeptide repeat protein [Candidatus Methanoperedens sp.]